MNNARKVIKYDLKFKFPTRFHGGITNWTSSLNFGDWDFEVRKYGAENIYKGGTLRMYPSVPGTGSQYI